MLRVGLSLLTLDPGRAGGSETYVRGLLAELARGPHAVRVLANARAAATLGELPPGSTTVRTLRTPLPGGPAPWRAAAIVAELLAPRRGPGVDVLHHPLTVPVPRARVPSVLTLHDVQHHELPFPAAERALRRLTYDRAARRATLVVTPSAHARDRAAELIGLDPASVEVIPHGIDHGRFTPRGPRDEQLLAPLALPERFVLYPANLWPHKNHARLLEALAATDPATALVLTGEAYGRGGELDASARRHGVGGRVRHLGHLPAEVLPALYRRARALVFPSLYEGFGSPPLEAMACGCPVAASARGAVAEVCGDAAEPLDPEDAGSIAAAIDRVTGDEPLRARLREAGLRRAAGFTWAESAARHVAAYERAAGV